MPKIIDEGRLQFIFPDGWSALQFDATKFYRYNIPTGIGVTAVDFIAFSNDAPSSIKLIEVKDFRQHGPEARKRQTSGELIKEVIKKAIDTTACFYLSAYMDNKELEDFVDENLFPPTDIELILFMEEDAFDGLTAIERHNYKIRFADMQLMFKRLKSKINIRSRILNMSLLKARDGFEVAYL